MHNDYQQSSFFLLLLQMFPNDSVISLKDGFERCSIDEDDAIFLCISETNLFPKKIAIR